MAKRDIFGELMEGVAAMKGHREGKITLRTHKVEASPLPKVDRNSFWTRGRSCAVRARFSRAQAAHQRTNAGKMGTGTRETQSSGRRTGAAGAPISGHAGATG